MYSDCRAAAKRGRFRMTDSFTGWQGWSGAGGGGEVSRGYRQKSSYTSLQLLINHEIKYITKIVTSFYLKHK